MIIYPSISSKFTNVHLLNDEKVNYSAIFVRVGSLHSITIYRVIFKDTWLINGSLKYLV